MSIAGRIGVGIGDDRLLPAGRPAWRALRSRPGFWIGLSGVACVSGLALFAPLLAPFDPGQSFRDVGLTAHGDPVGPSPLFPLGTAVGGYDLLTLLLYGARTSLIVGVGGAGIATAIGLLVGCVAAYAGTPRVGVTIGSRVRLSVALPIEGLLMRFTDFVLSFPVLLLAFALVAVLGKSVDLVVLVVAGVLWTGMARLVHSYVLVLRNAEFVLAARAAGIGPRRILLRHIGPHLAPLVVATATLGVATAILLESTLTFLGAGVPVGTPSWGGIIVQHASYIGDPRLVGLPAFAIVLTILSFTLLGNAVAEALDPRTRT